MYISHRMHVLYIYLHLVVPYVNMKVNMAYIYIYIGWYLFQNDIFLHQHEQINWHPGPWTSTSFWRFCSGFCCCFPRALGFLMIQNILCFTSGIVNALCIIDMGPLALNKRSCLFCFRHVFKNDKDQAMWRCQIGNSYGFCSFRLSVPSMLVWLSRIPLIVSIWNYCH